VLLFVYPFFGLAVLIRVEVCVCDLQAHVAQTAILKIASVGIAYHDTHLRTVSDDQVGKDTRHHQVANR
jgi:hypothetical protein